MPQLQLQAKAVDLEQMKEAREKAEEELMEKENALQKELREHEKEKKRLEEKHQQEVNLKPLQYLQSKRFEMFLIRLPPFCLFI